jgi:hypothetical protein
MKKKQYVSFNIPSEGAQRVREALASINCERWWRPPPNERGLSSFANTFDSDDPRLGLVKALATREGLRIFDRVEISYSDTELRSFPLLGVGVDRKPIESGRPEFGTTYDVTRACSCCGTGAIQTSPLMLALSDLPKNGLLCSTCRGQILAATKLATALSQESVTGLELRQACFYRNNEPLPWWQLITTYTMPKISKASKNLGRDTNPGWGCPACERDMYVRTNTAPLDLVYDRREVDPNAIPDVVQTWECFGRSILNDDPKRNLQRGFAQPQILVKPKVLDIMRTLSAKEAGFSPVQFV